MRIGQCPFCKSFNTILRKVVFMIDGKKTFWKCKCCLSKFTQKHLDGGE